MITIGPTGSIVTGDVLDISKSAVESALKFYDSQLYIQWNPEKLNGHGCWELRRRPEFKTAMYQCDFEGYPIYDVDYLETDMNHVKDFAFLNYYIVEWVKRSDTWAKFDAKDNFGSFINNVERAEKEKKEATKAKLKSELRYNIMQDRKVIKDFRDRISNGVNPALLGKYWK